MSRWNCIKLTIVLFTLIFASYKFRSELIKSVWEKLKDEIHD